MPAKNVKMLSSQLNRLTLKLVEYEFHIKHKLGTAMKVPDTLKLYPGVTQVIPSEVQGEIKIMNIQKINVEQLQLADTYLFNIRQASLDPESADKAHLSASRL